MYETSPRRALTGLLAGALAGGIVLAGIDTAGNADRIISADQKVIFFLARCLVETVIWLFALGIFGLIPWALLHNSGRRSLITAVTTGFLVSFLILIGISTLPFLTSGTLRGTSAWAGGQVTVYDGHLTLSGLQQALRGATFIGLLGAFVSAVVWRLSYTKIG